MIYLIAGATHTGKTNLAQALINQTNYPCLNEDLLKMGLIRSHQTQLTVEDDEELTPFLWSIVKEMIKTAIENEQNLIIEGCYIPFDWKKDFDEFYLKNIKYVCLIMSKKYLKENFLVVKKYGSVIEKRLDDSNPDLAELVKENTYNLKQCQKNKLNYYLINSRYEIELKNLFS